MDLTDFLAQRIDRLSARQEEAFSVTREEAIHCLIAQLDRLTATAR